MFQLGYDMLGMEKNFYWIVLIVSIMIIGSVLFQLKLIRSIKPKEDRKKAFRETIKYGCFILIVYLMTYIFLHFMDSSFPTILE